MNIKIFTLVSLALLTSAQEGSSPSESTSAAPSKEEIARQQAQKQLDSWQSKENEARDNAEAAMKELQQLVSGLKAKSKDKAAVQSVVDSIEHQARSTNSDELYNLESSWASVVGKLEQLVSAASNKPYSFLATDGQKATPQKEDGNSAYSGDKTGGSNSGYSGESSGDGNSGYSDENSAQGEETSEPSAKSLAKQAKKYSKKIYELQKDRVKSMKKLYSKMRSQGKDSAKDLYKKVKQEAKVMLEAGREVEKFGRKAGKEESEYEGNYGKVEHDSEKLAEGAEHISEKSEDLVEEFYEKVEEQVEERMDTLEDKANEERKKRDSSVKELLQTAKEKSDSETDPVSLAAAPENLDKSPEHFLRQSLVLPCLALVAAFSLAAAARFRNNSEPSQYLLLG